MGWVGLAGWLAGLWAGGALGRGQHQTKPRISGFGLLQHKPTPGFVGLVWEAGRLGGGTRMTTVSF